MYPPTHLTAVNMCWHSRISQ